MFERLLTRSHWTALRVTEYSYISPSSHPSLDPRHVHQLTPKCLNWRQFREQKHLGLVYFLWQSRQSLRLEQERLKNGDREQGRQGCFSGSRSPVFNGGLHLSRGNSKLGNGHASCRRHSPSAGASVSRPLQVVGSVFSSTSSVRNKWIKCPLGWSWCRRIIIDIFKTASD